MRILRIQFENLNSLRTGVIDLQTGPLAQAGLFAITGPTGSGKSTLLDALTLALYGKAARYENVPNPESMMSRHTGHCQAEVTFEVNGAVYRAEWQLRRARGRPDGKVQPPARRLYNAAGEVLAEKQTDADRLVEELTGLDYPRFLRSVLLAQGQFAQFLKTGPNQRAELLESLTGTVIYSELGALAYREATTREAALNEREAALGRVVFLTDEEREARRREIDEREAAAARLTDERKAVADRIARGRQRLDLAARQLAIRKEQAALAEEEAGAAPDRQRLARHTAAEPFRPALQTLEELLARATTEQTAAETATENVRTAAGQRAAGREAALRVGLRGIEKAEATLTKARVSFEETATTLSRLRSRRAETAADEALEESLPTLADALARLAALRHEAARAERAIAEQKANLAALRKTVETDTAAHHAAVARVREATARRDTAQQALAALLKNRTLDVLTQHSSRMSQKLEAFSRLRTVMEKLQAAKQEGVRIANEEQELTGELDDIRKQQKETEEEAAAQGRLLELARNHLHQLEKMTAFEPHRADLQPGEPCPLCGALEHPLIRPGANLSHEMEDARRNVTTARAAYETAGREAALANTNLARAEERIRILQKRRAELRTEQIANHEAFTELGRAFRVFTPEQLDEAEAALKATHRQHQETVRKALAAREAVAETEKAFLQAEAEAERRAEALRASTGAVATAEQALAEREAVLAEQACKLTETTTALEAPLQRFGLTPPKPGAEAALRQTLEERSRQCRKLREEEARLALALQKAEHQVEEAEKQLQTASGKARRLENLVPGEEAAPSGPLPDWQCFDEAEAGLTALQREHERLLQIAATRRQLAVETRAAAQRQEAELLKALGGSPFATTAALREALLSVEEHRCLAQTVAGLERRKADAATRLRQTEEQLHSLSDAPGETELPALEERHATLEKALVTATEERATLRAELEADTKARTAHTAEARAIREAREELAIWLQLRDLIGSADGRKFSRFAQGLSLGLLIHHANRHLARLNDRYRVERVPEADLELEIIDHHQADARRPTASLSGGETFLVSLALALGLSDLAGRNTRVDSLFIDEGFGTLDADLLDTALAALEALQARHKTIGIISHVELLKERIAVQIRVEKGPGGISRLHLPE